MQSITMKELQPHEQRVVDEQKELELKLTALGSFIDNGKPAFIDDVNWSLLDKQYQSMSDYNGILKQRISLFS